MILLGITGYEHPNFDNYFPDNSDKLSYYSKRSPVLELNNSFYETPDEEAIKNMYNSTPKNYSIIGRMLKSVTLEPDSLNIERIHSHLNKLKILKEKMPMVLFHFNKKFVKSEKTENYLMSLMSSCNEIFNGHLLMDLPNTSWMKYDDKLKELLTNHSASMVNTDKQLTSPLMRDNDVYYLRLLGDRDLVPTSKLGEQVIDRSRDILYWAKYIKSLKKRHKMIFIMIDHHFSGNAFKDSELLSKSLIELNVKFQGFKPK